MGTSGKLLDSVWGPWKITVLLDPVWGLGKMAVLIASYGDLAKAAAVLLDFAWRLGENGTADSGRGTWRLRGK